ncbi:MAG TPA: efflux RND transporter periplasmic adaptor subunit [Ktedonobacteraceae bacterium]
MLEQRPGSEDLDLPSFADDEDRDEDEKIEAAQKRARRRRRYIAIAVVLLIIILVPVIFFATRGLRMRRVTYQFRQVTQGNIALVVSATGPVQGTIYNADFLATGRISEIDVKLGQSVNAGQTLAKIDNTALEDALKQAQASLQQQKDFGTQDAINVAQDQVNTAQHNLNNATLTAPHAGVVTAINGAVGGMATGGGGGGSGGSSSGGGSSAVGFIQIVDRSSLQVQANVNESDIGGVAVGQAVSFTVNAYGSRTFHGTVSAIAPLGQSASNVVTYPVTINVDTKSIQGANVLPGMTASVTITIATHSNALLVPVDAINFAQASTQISSGERDAALSQARQMMAGLQSGGTGSSKSNMTASYVLELANNRWTAKPVVLGLTDGTSYEVLSGLTLGENVAVGVQGGGGGTPGPVGRPGTGIGG